MADSQQKEFISEKTERAVCTYAQTARNLLMNQFAMRTNLEQIDRYYMRETDWTEDNIRARIANRIGDKTKYQNPQIPIVMPQVRAALAYMINVFLTGYPTFGVAGDPNTEDAALQIETIIAENSITAGWSRELMMFFGDGLKYNLHAVECEWTQRTVGSVETDISYPNSAKPVTTLWQGQSLRRMDLYNTFFDPRVHPAECYKYGEYAGYIELYSRIRLKQMMNDLFGKVPKETVIRAFNSGPSPGGMTGSGTPYSYYMPLINPFPIMARQNLQTFDWMAWWNASPETTGNRGYINYSGVYEVTTLYAKILPSDFDLNVPGKNTPQIWKFKIINGQVVIFAEQQTDAHGYIPILFGQPLEDGLDFQTKSFASNVMDMQDIASAAWAAYIASKRRLVGDRVIYDPLRIREKDINSTNPAAKIPVRPSAYGKNVSEAVYQFPFHDEQTASLVEASNAITGMADKINAQNPAQQGQFVKGNKTKFEYDDVMGHGNGGNQAMALMSEAQVFTPMKEIIKLNILQRQQATTLYNRDKKQQVKIDPVQLRKAAVHFKVSDGMLPEEKQLSTDEFQTALQTIGSSPQLSSGYDVPKLFTYLMKIRGADLSPFEKSPLEIQYEKDVQLWTTTVQELLKVATKGFGPEQLQQFLEGLNKLQNMIPKPPAALQQEQQGGQQGGQQQSQSGQAEETTQGS